MKWQPQKWRGVRWAPLRRCDRETWQVTDKPELMSNSGVCCSPNSWQMTVHVLLVLSGVARPLVARCGCQICRPSVIEDTGEPIQPCCLHFLALHRNTVTRSVSQHLSLQLSPIPERQTISITLMTQQYQYMIWFFVAFSYVRAVRHTLVMRQN